jgi:hypothetical protein
VDATNVAIIDFFIIPDDGNNGTLGANDFNHAKPMRPDGGQRHKSTRTALQEKYEGKELSYTPGTSKRISRPRMVSHRGYTYILYGVISDIGHRQHPRSSM